MQPNRGLIQRLQWAFNPHFLNVHGCIADATDRERLLNQLGDFDRCAELADPKHSESMALATFSSRHRRSAQLSSAPSGERGRIKEKMKAGVQMHLLKRREHFWKKRFTVLSVAVRRPTIQAGTRAVIPNGFERPAQEPMRQPTDPPRIGFIGLYSYLPNLEGMKWFVRSCWPLIKQQVPDARLRLVGKDTDGPLKPNAPDVDALGYVHDAASEMATWSAMVIPAGAAFC